MYREKYRDTQCAYCGKWTHKLSDGSRKIYCDDRCRNRDGVPGINQIKRRLKEGEIVEPSHITISGTRLGNKFYLVGKPYPSNPITECYVIEDKA